MSKIERISTEYIDIEDRVRLAGEVENAATVVVWFTQRLLQRLLPTLLQGLERQSADTPRSALLHSFALQAARAELTPQAPVQTSTDSTAWLARSVDITYSKQAVSLNFRGVAGENATLALAATPLRQWLGILHDTYLKAGWPLDVWPEWVRESARLEKRQETLLH